MDGKKHINGTKRYLLNHQPFQYTSTKVFTSFGNQSIQKNNVFLSKTFPYCRLHFFITTAEALVLQTFLSLSSRWKSVRVRSELKVECGNVEKFRG